MARDREGPPRWLHGGTLGEGHQSDLVRRPDLLPALSGKRGDFSTALHAAPNWLLAIAALLQAVALVARSEAWHVCVGAAGGTVSRRRLYRAASVGYLGTAERVLLTATGTVGALGYMTWALADRLWGARRLAPA